MEEDPISRVVEPVARMAAIVCGYAVLLLSLAVSVEIVGRKLFSHSFPGTDDIGGYVLAIIAVVGASYTMAKRGHTRVDIFLVMMSTALAAGPEPAGDGLDGGLRQLRGLARHDRAAGVDRIPERGQQPAADAAVATAGRCG